MARKSKQPRGRPTSYSPRLAALICERIAEGKSLRKICQTSKMPNRATVMRWLALHADFRDQYARAREAQADLLADEISEIADAAKDDVNVQSARLRIDARKWLAGKLRPKVYGERVLAEHSGPGGAPIEHQQVGPVTVKLVNGDGTPLLASKPDAKR